MDVIRAALEEGIRLRRELLAGSVEQIKEVAEVVVEALKGGRKVYLFGNGGSAADAQHVAAELVGRFRKDRPPLPAVALTTDTSVLTAIGNDFGYDNVFARQVAALVGEGDVVIGLSTSGSAENVIAGMMEARRRKARCIGLTGESGGRLKGLVEQCICIASRDAARIQECHITIGHIVCGLVEDALFGDDR